MGGSQGEEKKKKGGKKARGSTKDRLLGSQSKGGEPGTEVFPGVESADTVPPLPSFALAAPALVFSATSSHNSCLGPVIVSLYVLYVQPSTSSFCMGTITIIIFKV